MSCPDAPLLGRPVRRLVGLKACGQRASRSLNPLVRDRGPLRCHPRPGSAPSPWVLPPVPLLTQIQPARFSFFCSFFTLTFLPPHLEVGDNFLCSQNCPILFFTGYDGLLVNTVAFLSRNCHSQAYQKILWETSLAVLWLGLCTSTAGGIGMIPGLGTKIPTGLRACPPPNNVQNKFQFFANSKATTGLFLPLCISV